MRACRSLARLTRIGDRTEHATILSCGKTSEALEATPEKSWVVVPDHRCNVVGRGSGGLRAGVWYRRHDEYDKH